MKNDAGGTVKSADRVVTLFELLARWRSDMSHAEIAEVLEIPKSSLTQLLRNLVSRGWLAYSPETKCYRLGEAIVQLSDGVAQTRSLVELSKPVLSALTRATKETSALNLLRNMEAEVAATFSSPERLIAALHEGDRTPLYTTSGGKAILAFLSQDLQEEYLASVELVPVTPRTISSAEELRLQMETIRKEGIAYSFEEQTPGVIGTARPILTRYGEVLGSLSIAAPAVRYTKSVRTSIADALEHSVGTLVRQLSAAGEVGARRRHEPAAPHTADAAE